MRAVIDKVNDLYSLNLEAEGYTTPLLTGVRSKQLLVAIVQGLMMFDVVMYNGHLALYDDGWYKPSFIGFRPSRFNDYKTEKELFTQIINTKTLLSTLKITHVTDVTTIV